MNTILPHPYQSETENKTEHAGTCDEEIDEFTYKYKQYLRSQMPNVSRTECLLYHKNTNFVCISKEPLTIITIQFASKFDKYLDDLENIGIAIPHNRTGYSDFIKILVRTEIADLMAKKVS